MLGKAQGLAGRGVFVVITGEFVKYENLYHGTTSTKMNEVLKTGFDNKKWIMFTTRKEEAIRYANSYCAECTPNGFVKKDIPVLLTLSDKTYRIADNDTFKKYATPDNALEVKKLLFDNNVDGVFSDPPSEYYVIFNVDKLNQSIADGGATFSIL